MPILCKYYVHWHCGVVGMLFTYRMKSSGLRFLPCGVPAKRLTFSDRLASVFTWMVLSFRKDATMCRRSGGMS